MPITIIVALIVLAIGTIIALIAVVRQTRFLLSMEERNQRHQPSVCMVVEPLYGQ